MNKFSVLLICSLALVLNSGCSGNEPCDIFIMPPIASFTLQKKGTNTTLIGPNKAYHPDSILALNLDFCPYLRRHQADTHISFDYAGIPSGEAIPFFISASDIDTFSIVYSLVPTDCGDLKELKYFVYNRDTTEFRGQFAIGEKQ